MDVNKSNINAPDSMSSVIQAMRFPAIYMVVCLHAYTTLQGNHLGQFYNIVIYLLSLVFGEVGVPLFYVISGYLFFANYHGLASYKKKLSNRIHSLLIPYLFWNGLFILLYALVQSFPQFSSFFSGTNKPIAEYGWKDYLEAFWSTGGWNNGDGTPILQPYWYIRNLMLLCIASPVIYYLIRFFKYFVMIPLVLWVMSPSLAFGYSSLAFFSIGAMLAIEKVDVIKCLSGKVKQCLIAFLSFTVLDYSLIGTDFFSHIVHRTNVISAMLLFVAIFIDYPDKVRTPKTWTDASFFIYTLHFPILLLLRKVGLKLYSLPESGIQVLIYMGCILATICICYLLYFVLKKTVPKFLSVINGR